MNVQKEFAALLENLIVPVNLPQNEDGNFPSFHPKIWLMQFRKKDGSHFYRSVILSRNISYDKCYDACFVLESSDNHLKTKRTKPIIDFLQYLKNEINEENYPFLRSQKKMISEFISDLTSEKVCFSLNDERFPNDDFDISPFFDSKYRRSFSQKLFATKGVPEKEKYDSVFLMSPFVSEKFLDDIIACTKSDTKVKLITRKTEVDSIDEKYNQFFDAYILSSAIVEPDLCMEDRDEVKDVEVVADAELNILSDIHAKIFIVKRKKNTDFYIGSANATYSAMNRNIEFMVRIGCDKKFFSPEEIFEEINPDGNPNLKKVSFKKINSDELDVQKKIEHLVKLLSRSDAHAEVFKNSERYNIEIYFPPILHTLENVKILISPFSYQEEKALAENIIFEDVPLDFISEFYILKVIYTDKNDSEEEICIERTIKIPTENIPYVEREESVVNKIISDADSFAEYVTLLLSKTPSVTQAEIMSLRESNAKWRISNTQNPLYETLLRATVLNPSAIKNLAADLCFMKNTIVSEEFRMMYKEFIKAIQDE